MTVISESGLQQKNFEIPQDVHQSLLSSLVGLGPECFVIAVQRVVKLVEIGVPPCALAMAVQILYRTLSSNKFTEAIPTAARRAQIGRSLAFKGIKILLNLNVVTRTKRNGKTDEYEFTHIDQWQQYVAPIREKKSRTSPNVEVTEFQQESSVEQISPGELTKPMLMEGIPCEDTSIVALSHKEQRQEKKLNNSHKNTRSIWRANRDGTRYAQIPPIYNQVIGVEIQRQMSEEGLTAQAVISRAMAFSKIPLLLLEALAHVGTKLADGVENLMQSELSHPHRIADSHADSHQEIIVPLPLVG